MSLRWCALFVGKFANYAFGNAFQSSGGRSLCAERTYLVILAPNANGSNLNLRYDLFANQNTSFASQSNRWRCANENVNSEFRRTFETPS